MLLLIPLYVILWLVLGLLTAVAMTRVFAEPQTRKAIASGTASSSDWVEFASMVLLWPPVLLLGAGFGVALGLGRVASYLLSALEPGDDQQ